MMWVALMRFVNYLKFILTWWNSQTPGTWFFTWRKGIKVGEDDQGNIYYKQRGGPRRWVIYNGLAEPSRIPPEWHGWMHHRVDVPPVDEEYTPRPWQLPPRANYTGTPYALYPPGSLLRSGKRPRSADDYEPWRPE